MSAIEKRFDPKRKIFLRDVFDRRLTSDKLLLLLVRRKIEQVERMDLGDWSWTIEYIKSMEKVKGRQKKKKSVRLENSIENVRENFVEKLRVEFEIRIFIYTLL